MAKFKLPRWLQTLVSSKPTTIFKPRPRQRLVMETLEDRVTPTTLLWDGGGGSGAWSDPLNWNDNIHNPGTADAPVDLVFPSGVSNTTTNNDIVGLAINSISFSGSNYNVSGLGLTLGGAASGSGYIVANAGAINNIIDLPIQLGGIAGNRQFFTVGTVGAFLTISSQLSGTSGVELSKDGPGTLILTSDNSPFTGPVSIVEGALNIRNALALGDANSPTTVLSTVQKSGQLQVENVNGDIAEPLSLNGSGPLNDGALLNVAGVNTWTGDIELDSDATIGATAGSLIINGIISDLGAGHNLTKEGPGTIVLDPINPVGTPASDTGNSYRGRTFVNDGTLTIRHSLALGNDATPIYGINDTVVQSAPNRSGTLDLEFVANPGRIDPNVNPTNDGFTVPTELLTLNGPGFEGIHVLPKQALPAGNTVHGALHNTDGFNTWVQDIQLWSGDSAVVGDATVWNVNGVLPTVGIGAEATGELIITGHVLDTFLSGTPFLTTRTYSLIKTRPGRVQFVHDNTYRGRTEILEGYLNIADSQALGASTLDDPRNGTFIFPGGTLELEADSIPDSVTPTDPPHGLPHLNTDIVITTENLRPLGNGANNDGAIRSIRGVNEIPGNLQLQRRIPRGGVAFNGLGASFGVLPDYNIGSPTQTLFDRSQLTLSGTVADDTIFFNTSSNLTKFGQGELVLTNSNTYTGRTFISEGWITARDDHALGSIYNISVVNVNGAKINAPTFEDLSDTKSPETYIAPGAMLVLKQTRSATPTNINLDERIFVSGDGIDHGSESNFGYTVIGGQAANLELNHNGAILNLSGNNTISGIVTLVTANGQSTVGIGADLDSTDPTVTQSSLAFINIIRDTIDPDNIGDQNTLPGPGRFNGSPVSFFGSYPYQVGAQAAGINKLGRKRVLLQGPGYFTGNNVISEGVLRVQNDIGLGQVAGTTTVADGAALEIAGYNTTETKLPQPVEQYANSVFAFSTQFTTGPWAASQAIWDPDTFNYGDIPTAWSALFTDGPPNPEFVDFRFKTPVYATSLEVRETYNNGFVTQIELVDVNDVYHTIFSGPDTTPRGAPGNLTLNFPITNYLVKGAKVTVNPLAQLGDWEEIDSIKLNGMTLLAPTTVTINTFNGGLPGGLQLRESLVLNGAGNTTADDPTNNLSDPSNRIATLTSVNEDNQFRSPISLATNVNIATAANSRMTFWKPVSGPGGFTKEGDGKLVLGGINTYLGDTIISKGIVNLESSSALGNPSVSETQQVTVTGTSGNFTLTFNGQTTVSLPFNATAGQVQSALNNLSSIGPAGSVTVSLSLGIYSVTFGGSLANTNLPPMTATSTGGVSATVSTPVDGGGGTFVANEAQIELQGDITIGGEALTIQGNGPNATPNIPLRWFAQGPGPINDTSVDGNTVTGRVTGVATDPLDPNVIYLSAAGGGAWRTRNGGVTWEPLIDNINGTAVTQALFTGAIAVAPTNSSRIYVGLGESNNSGDSYYGRGILKSADYGKTWNYIQPPGNAFDKHTISKIVVDPTEPDTIYVTVFGFGINEGLDGNGNPANYSLWRMRNGVWKDLLAGVTAPIPFNNNPPSLFFPNLNNIFTDVIVIDINPRITSQFNADLRTTRLIAFAIGDPFGDTDNAVYVSSDADLSSTVAPTWSLAGFPTTEGGFPTRNGMIKIAGARRLSNPNIVDLFASLTYPDDFPRFLQGTANTFREVQATTYTISTGALANWAALGTQPAAGSRPQGIFGVDAQGSYDSVIAEQTQLVNIPWMPTGEGQFTTLGNQNFLFLAGTGYAGVEAPLVYNGSAWGAQNPGTSGKAPHVDYHATTFDSTGRLIVGTDGGIWRMENLTAPGANGGLWSNLNQANPNIPSFLQITTFNSVDVHPFNPFFAIGGSQDNGTEIYNDSQVWTNTDGGDGGTVQINNINPNIVFKTENGALFRSLQAGAPGSWQNTGVGSGSLYFPVIIDRVNPSRVLVGSGSNLLESNQDGAPGTFQVIGAASSIPNGLGSTGGGIFSFSNQIAVSNRQGPWVLDPSFPLVLDQGAETYDSDTIYVLATGAFPRGGVFVTKNHGTAWVRRNGTGAGALMTSQGDFSDYSQIVVDPRNRDVAYVTRAVFNGAAGKHVFKTTDAGQNWTDISGNLPDLPTWSIAINTRNSDLYVGTDNGLYYLAGGSGGNWQRYGVGLPNAMVSGITFNSLTNMLTVSTYGRGMYQLWLDDSRPNSGAIRAVTGSSLWTGPVTLAGNVDLRSEVNAQINFVGTIMDDTAGGNHLINKVGPGRVVFSSNNTFGGQVDVQEGALVVRSPNALGSPAAPAGMTTVEVGAALEMQSDLYRETVVLNGQGIKFNGHDTGSLRNVSNNNTFTGTLFLNSSVTIGVDSGSQLNIGTKPGDPTGVVNGVGLINDGAGQRGFVKELTGTLVLNSANTYDGLTDVVQGILRVENGSGLGSGVSGTQVRNGSQIQVGSSPSGSGITVVGETLILSGTGIFGTGALENFQGNNTWQGNVVFTAIQGVAAPPPPLPPSTINIGVLRAGDILTIDGVVSEQTVTIPAQQPTIPNPVTFTTFGLTKVLPGKLVLKGNTNNTYTGLTTVATGVVNVQKPQALGTIAVGTVVNNGAALETEGNVMFVAEALTLNGRGVDPDGSGPLDGQGALRNIIGDNVWTGPVTLNTTVPAGSGTPAPHVNLGADTPITEVQTVTVTGVSGNFTLTFNGQTTISLPYNATAIQVQNALNVLSSIGGVNGSVAVTLNVTMAGNDYVITFGGTLAGANQPSMVASFSGGATAVVNTTTPGSVSRLAITGGVQDPAGVPASLKAAELHKVGDGTIALPNANTYQGLTVVDNGVLNIRDDGSLGSAAAGTIVNPGGTLQMEGGFTETDEPLTLFGGGELGLGALANNKDINTWAFTVNLGDNNVRVGSNLDTLRITGQITDGANTFGLGKSGLGTVELTGATDNEIQGTTTVIQGTLLLNKPTDTFNFDGALTVGDGSGPADSAVLLLGAANEIPNSSVTTVNADGKLDLNSFTETITTLVVNDGHVQTDAGALTVGESLTMAGGNIELNGAGDQLFFGAFAFINPTSSAAETAVINGTGNLALVGSTPRLFRVTDGPGLVDLQISAPISRTAANERLIKDSAGTLQISSNANSLNGVTEAYVGLLQVDGTIGAVELNGGTLGGNGITGTVTSLFGGGKVNPGDSPGILRTGDVVWNSRTTYFVELNRLNPTPSALNLGVDYDSLFVNGSINLNGAHLSGLVDAIGVGIVTDDPQTTVGDIFTIIQSFPGNVVGQFAEGDHVFIDGKKFNIAYFPKYVQLTKVKADVTIDLASSGNPSVWGQPVTFTITAIPEPGAIAIPPTATVDIHLFGPNEDVMVSTPLVNGSFSFNPLVLFGVHLEVGLHNLGVKFHDPTKNFQDYPTVPEQFLTQTVNRADSTIALVSSSVNNTSVYGDSNVRITAKLGIVAPGGTENGTNVITGTVQFNRDGFNQGGPANVFFNGTQYVAEILVPANLAVGTYRYSAAYSGDVHFNFVATTQDLVQNIIKANTAVGIIANPSPSDIGQNVTFTVTVSAVNPSTGAPTGTVTIKDGSTTFDSHALVSITETQVVAVSGSAGSFTLTFNGQTTSALAFDATASQVETALNLLSTIGGMGGAVTVTFAGGNYTVTFGGALANGNQPQLIGNATGGASVAVSTQQNGGGQWLFQISTLTFGTHTINVDYSGDTNFNISSGSVQQVVRGNTLTTITSSLNPSTYGQNVTFTVTVSALAPASGIPGGSVDILDNGVLIPAADDLPLAANGQVTYSTNSLTGVTHTITAHYNGAPTYKPSDGTVVQTVNKANTNTTLSATPANPTVYGQSINFSATVSILAPGGGTLSGTVDFLDNGNLIAGGDDVPLLNGVATLSTTFLPAGVHSNITAKYNGTINYNISTSLPINRTVNKANTQTALATSVPFAVYGQAVITAKVTAIPPGGNTPVGDVTFFVTNTLTSTTTQRTITLDAGGVANYTPTLDVGSYSIVAQYNGNANYNPSANSNTISQTVSQASTSTALATADDDVVYGESIITATVTTQLPGQGTPIGLVIFHVNNGSNTDYQVTLDMNGVATLPQLDAGNYTITADYTGSTNFVASVGSPTIFQSIHPANSSVAVASSVNPSRFGQQVTFTATVSAVSPGFGTPPGSVQFIIDGVNQTPLGVTLVNGQASFSISSLSVTAFPHDVQVTYSGSNNFNPSNGTLTNGQTVLKGDTSTLILSSLNPSPLFATVTFTATVSASSPSVGTPSGFVRFVIDNVQQVPDAQLNNFGQAQLSFAFGVQGDHTVRAFYQSDGNFNQSDGVLTQNVKADSSTTVASNAVPSSIFGQMVTFTATINPVSPLPTGTVRFIIDGTTVASAVPLSGNTATFQTSTLTVTGSPHTVQAHYNGDVNWFPSDGTLLNGQTVTKASTSTGVTSNTPTVFGQSATFTATVTNLDTGATPAGSVTFIDQFDNSNLGTFIVAGSGNSATASVTTANLAAANNHVVVATFNPSNDFLGSNGNTTHVVNAANTTTTVASSSNPSVFQQNVTFTATVQAVAPGAGTATGFVRFFIDGSIQTPDRPLSGGQATFSTTTLAIGTHTVTAQYLGSANFNGSVGNLNPDQKVNPNPVAFIVTPGGVVSGKTFTVVVQYRNAANTGPDPNFNGPVSIAVNTGPAGGVLGGVATVNAVNGTAVFSLTLFRAGSYTLQASVANLPPVVSNNIEVLASSLIAATAPARVFAGSPFSINAFAVDVTGQVAGNYNGLFTLTVVKKPVLSRVAGPKVGTFSGGFGSLNGLRVSKAGIYTLRINGPNGLTRTIQIRIRARRAS